MLSNTEKELDCSEILGESTNGYEYTYNHMSYNMSIGMHCTYEDNRTDDVYFKVYNAFDPEFATKCCRIKILKAVYKNRPIDSSKDEFILSDNDKISLMRILHDKFDDDNTVWEHIVKTCLVFTKENKKMQRLLKKSLHKIPDYTKL